MEYTFVESPEGLIDAAVVADAPILAHAMVDSLGTRPPPGHLRTDRRPTGLTTL